MIKCINLAESSTVDSLLSTMWIVNTKIDNLNLQTLVTVL